MGRLSSQDLQAFRWSLQPEFAGMPDEMLEQVVDEAFADLPPEAAENVLGAVGNFAKAAAPGVLQGAATGGMAAGPYGALIGAGLGLASSALAKKPKPPRPAPAAMAASPLATPPTMAAAANAVGAIAPTVLPSLVNALPTGQGAAATFLQVLQDPTVQQALMSQVLGSFGAKTVTTGSGAELPRAAVNALLSTLLNNASEGLDENGDVSEQAYLTGSDGTYLVDPSSPEQQAALVLARLQVGKRAAGWNADSVESVEFYR